MRRTSIFHLHILFVSLFLSITIKAQILNDSLSLDLSNLPVEDIDKMIWFEVEEANQKKGIEKTNAAFELLKYEPHLSQSPLLKSSIFHMVARQLAHHKAHLLSAEYNKLAFQFRKQHQPNQHFSRWLGDIGWQYHLAGMPDSALLYMRTSAFGNDKNNPIPATAPHYNNLGMLYQEMKNDSAYYFYKIAEAHIKNPKDIFITSIRDNLAAFHFQKKEYEQALAIYQLNDFFLKNESFEEGVRLKKILNRKLKAKIGIVKTLLQIHRYQEATPVLDEATKLFYQIENKSQEKVKEFFSIKLLYAKKLENLKMKANYQDSLFQLHQVMEEENNMATKIAMSSLFNLKLTKFDKELELQLAINQRKEQQIKYANLVSYISWTLGIALLVAAILFFQKRIARHKHEILEKKKKVALVQSQLLEKNEEQKQLQKSLHQTERDLLDFSTYISDNRSWSNQLVLELEKISKTESTVSNDIQQLLKGFQHRLHLDEKMKLQIENIDKINHMFFDKLSEKFPDLTDSEKELCGLFRLNLSQKDIAIFRNISPQSLKMSKYRLRKKLQLSSEINLSSYLNSIDYQ